MAPDEMSRRTLLKSSLLGTGAALASGWFGGSAANAAFLQDKGCRSGTPILVKAAINGRRLRADHPTVPLSPDDLAAAARESVAAGARALHIHVRSRDGSQSVEPADVAGVLTVVRAAVPGTPVGVSTNSSSQPDPELRNKSIAAWTVLPDFCSVNIREEGALQLAELLLSRGIGLEPGLNDGRQVELIVRRGLAPKCLRMLLEPGGASVEESLQTANEIESALDQAGNTVRRLLHGSNRTAWPVMDVAIARGYDIRVGFEDMLTLPNDAKAESNGALVAEAVRRVRAVC